MSHDDRRPARCCPWAAARTSPPSAASSARATCRPRPTPTWWRARGGQGGAGRAGCSCSVTTTSATRSSSSPTSPATRSSSPATPRPGRRRSTSSSAACTSWPSRPTSSPRPTQHVVLPDLAAGCSMADMARLAQVEDCWDALTDAGLAEHVVPVTYMNSSADIKAFCGRHGGAVCTSSNADVALEWAFEQKPDAKVLFLPDQHLGRNTAVLKLGMSLDDCVVWDPRQPGGGADGRGAAATRPDDPVEGALLGARPVLGRRRRRAARDACPTSRSWCTPSAPTRWSLRPTWSARRSSSSRPSRPRRRVELGDRHRAQPGPAARRGSTPSRTSPSSTERLLLLDDEPDRPPAPGVGPGVAGRRRGRQPDPGRPRHRALAPRSRCSGCSTCPGRSHRD